MYKATVDIALSGGYNTRRPAQKFLRRRKSGHLGEQASIDTHSRFRGSTPFEGLSLREIEAVLGWLGTDRCNQAIWNWRETL